MISKNNGAANRWVRGSTSSGLELQEERCRHSVLTVTKIGCPARHDRSRRSLIPSRRRYTPRTGEVRNVRCTVVVLQPIGEVLTGHVVNRHGRVPCLEGITRVLREVRRARSCGRPINRREKNKIATGVVDAAASDRQSILIAIEPEAVVFHETKEALLGTSLTIAGAAHTTAALATHVAGERESGLAQERIRMVEILVLDAVVCVIPSTAWNTKRVFTVAILIAENLQFACRSPENLSPKTGPIVEAPIGLPSIDDPGFDLQLLRWEPLYAYAREEPWRVR